MSFLWIALALIACLSVALINGAPLYYYDSGGYLDNGLKVLRQIGLMTSPTSDAGSGLGGLTGEALGDHTVNGSRSVVYSILSAILGLGIGLKSLPLFHAMVVFMAVWLPVRVANRLYAPGWSESSLLSVPIVVAATGALPFYVAYLMPDIFSGAMLLVVALLTVFGRQMQLIEIIIALALGCLAVVSHLSHLAVLGLMVPASALVAVLLDRRKWWLPPLLVSAILAVGFAERTAFTVAAETVTDSEVVYYPFITARIIQDGPGFRYLNAHCPDAEIPTCALHTALSKSDDPMRLTASHIIFEKDPNLGSFRLMAAEDQQKVANRQFKFFLKVFADYPVATIGALLKNTFVQAQMNSIKMTVPEYSVFTSLAAIPSLPPNFLEPGRLSQDRGWIPSIDIVHQVIYAVSLAIVIALVVWPRRLATGMKAFAVMILLGILANAFVCGGISQPADRYGARVIWLLPLLATMLVMFSGLFRPDYQNSNLEGSST